MNINLHIERLVLEGLPLERWQGPHLQAAVEQELIRLLFEGRAPARFSASGNLGSITASSIAIPECASPAGLGKQIATAVHSGFGGQQ